MYYVGTAPVMTDNNLVFLVVITAFVHFLVIITQFSLTFSDPGIIPKILTKY